MVRTNKANNNRHATDGGILFSLSIIKSILLKNQLQQRLQYLGSTVLYWLE
jgi:hypothetical protein